MGGSGCLKGRTINQNRYQRNFLAASSLATGNCSKMDYLKTMNKQARQRGTTLIELSVVIAVLLLLVGVLFIGVTAWKTGANAAACIVNLASVQKAAPRISKLERARHFRRAAGRHS